MDDNSLLLSWLNLFVEVFLILRRFELNVEEDAWIRFLEEELEEMDGLVFVDVCEDG